MKTLKPTGLAEAARSDSEHLGGLAGPVTATRNSWRVLCEDGAWKRGRQESLRKQEPGEANVIPCRRPLRRV